METPVHPTPLPNKGQVKQGAPWKLVTKRQTRAVQLELEIVRLRRLVKQLEGSIKKVDTPKPGLSDTRKQRTVLPPQSKQNTQLKNRATNPQPNRKTRRLALHTNSVEGKVVENAVKLDESLSQPRILESTVGTIKCLKTKSISIPKREKSLGKSGTRIRVNPTLPTPAVSKRETLKKVVSKAQYPPDVVSVQAEPIAPSQKQSIVIDATPKLLTKKFPRVKGASYARTVAFNCGRQPALDDLSEMPIKSTEDQAVKRPDKRPSHGLFGWRKIQGVSELKRRQRCQISVDTELYGYLIYTFMFQARTPEVMSQMASKAKQFLAGFDLTDHSWEDLHKVSVQAITAAMNVPNEEVKLSDALANPAAAKERIRHADIVRKGESAKVEQSALAKLFRPKHPGGLAPKNL